MASARSGSVQTHINAPPERVWDLLAKVERMGEWSPECYRVEWLDGAASPATEGARFKGWNKFGWMRWSMTCEVKTAEPAQELSWSTVQGGRELTSWTYRLERANGGTNITESFDVHYLPAPVRLAEDLLMRDRDRRREEAMRATLQRIKAVAEAGG